MFLFLRTILFLLISTRFVFAADLQAIKFEQVGELSKLRFDFNKDEDLYVTKVNESRAAARILANAESREDFADVSFAGWCVDWMDDTDPNSVKQNRGGIYVKTVTFGAPNTRSNSFEHTYVVAVGPQHVDHGCVESLIHDDLLLLSGRSTTGNTVPWMYSKHHGALVLPHIEVTVASIIYSFTVTVTIALK